MLRYILCMYTELEQCEVGKQSLWRSHVLRVTRWFHSYQQIQVAFKVQTLHYLSDADIMSKPVIIQLDEETIRGIHGVEDLYGLPSVVRCFTPPP